VGFVVDKVALGQGFSEYFGVPCQSSFHQFSSQSPSPIIPGWYNRAVVAAVPKVPPHKLKKNILLRTVSRTLFPICVWHASHDSGKEMVERMQSYPSGKKNKMSLKFVVGLF
jgi:hypothetical protein